MRVGACLPLLGLMLGGCAATTESGRMQLLAPPSLSAAYSEVELQAQLAFVGDGHCRGADCEAAAAFRRRVGALGSKLEKAARELAPELGVPLPEFYIWVPPKREQGTLSSAAGSIAVFGGLREIAFDDPALAFLLAREMGHVIGHHHDENSAVSMFVSLAAALLLPVTNFFRGAAAAIPETSTLTATTSAASMFGTRVVKDIYRPEQLREADALALRILDRAGWTPQEVAAGLQAAAPRLGSEGWMAELRTSKTHVDQVAMGPPWPTPAAELVAAATFGD